MVAEEEGDGAGDLLHADGSEAEKSGNGLRIFSRFLWDRGRVGGEPFEVVTRGGGSEVTRHEASGRDSETRFTTAARLRNVYENFHDQLTRDGWRRTTLAMDDDEIEAEYERTGVSFELELERDGRDRFKLEIDLD